MNRRALVRRLRADDGSSLIIMLALLSFLGVLLASVLTIAFASFRTTEVTRAQGSELFGADGGIEYGIELLRDSSAYCPAVSGTPQSLPSQTLNGRTVSVTCQTLTGGSGTSSGPAGTYALVVTGYNYPGGGAPDFDKLVELDGKDKAGDDSIHIAGDMFNAGKFRFKSDSPILTIHSDLDQYQGSASYCTNDKSAAASSGNPTVQGLWTCRTSSSFPVPDPNPTVIVPTAAAPAATNVGTCTILYPGRYTTDPSFDKDRRYYLASGVYYFHNVGSIDFKGQIFGGQPGPNESQQFTDITPCADDATANTYRPGSATGYGVNLVLGGSSQLTIEDERKSKVELYSRVPANASAEGTAGLSVLAPKTAGTGYSAWNSGKAFDIKGKDPQIVVHGLVYVPTSRFDEQFVVANSSANLSPIFRGGLVVQWIKLKFKNDATNLTFAGLYSATPLPRTVVVTATAQGPTGAPTVVKAVVEVPVSSAGAPTVLSWRKV